MFFSPNNIIFLFFSSDFCYIVYYLLVLAKFMIFFSSLHKVFKLTQLDVDGGGRGCGPSIQMEACNQKIT